MKTALQFVGEIKEKNCSIDDFRDKLEKKERRLSYKTSKPITLEQKIEKERKHRVAAEELRNFRVCYFDIEDILKGIIYFHVFRRECRKRIEVRCNLI